MSTSIRICRSRRPPLFPYFFFYDPKFKTPNFTLYLYIKNKHEHCYRRKTRRVKAIPVAVLPENTNTSYTQVY